LLQAFNLSVQYSLAITKPAIANLWLYRSLAGKIFISPYKSLIITKSLFITYTERISIKFVIKNGFISG
jgi:hypothetical protein